jgi:hypothetical protein
VLPAGISLSLFEELLNEQLYFNKTLGYLEDCLTIATSYSYAVLGVTQGYSDGLRFVLSIFICHQVLTRHPIASAAAQAAGWNPKPTSVGATTPVLRVRLHMPLIPTLLGFVASLVCLATARIIAGSIPPLNEREELIASMSALRLLLATNSFI